MGYETTKDFVNWEIYEYDGVEHIYDKNRVWGL